MARYFRRRGRRSYRRRSVVPKRYSVETMVTSGVFNAENFVTTQYFTMIPPVQIQGMRKVTNMSVDFVLNGGQMVTFGYALVYMPNWFNLRQASASAVPALAAPNDSISQSLYEPNQHVLMQGIFNTTNNKMLRRFTRLSRNLNSEDSVVLLIRGYTSAEPVDVGFAISFQYAITFT